MTADQVYDVLVTNAGATDHPTNRAMFRHFWDHHQPGGLDEFRFMGSLGFGGKLWRNARTNECHVSCYREHETPERLATIAATDAALAALPR